MIQIFIKLHELTTAISNEAKSVKDQKKRAALVRAAHNATGIMKDLSKELGYTSEPKDKAKGG